MQFLSMFLSCKHTINLEQIWMIPALWTAVYQYSRMKTHTLQVGTILSSGCLVKLILFRKDGSLSFGLFCFGTGLKAETRKKCMNEHKCIQDSFRGYY